MKESTEGLMQGYNLLKFCLEREDRIYEITVKKAMGLSAYILALLAFIVPIIVIEFEDFSFSLSWIFCLLALGTLIFLFAYCLNLMNVFGRKSTQGPPGSHIIYQKSIVGTQAENLQFFLRSFRNAYAHNYRLNRSLSRQISMCYLIFGVLIIILAITLPNLLNFKTVFS